MKAVWRVLYLIYAVILLLVVMDVATRYQEELYFKNEGKVALEKEDVTEKFHFFYSAAGYHTLLPVMIKENDDFVVAFYEIYRKEEANTFFYIMLYPKIFDENERVLFELSFNQDLENKKTYEFDRFRNLQMYVLVNKDRQALIPFSEIKEINPYSFTVIKHFAAIDYENEIVYEEHQDFEFIYNVDESDLIVTKAIKEFGLDQDKLQLNNVYPKLSHRISKYKYVYHLSFFGALVVVFLGAYFLFYFKKGKKTKLGRQKPTKEFTEYQKEKAKKNIESEAEKL